MRPPFRIPRAHASSLRTVVGVAFIAAIGVPPVAHAAIAGDDRTAAERAPLVNAVTATVKGERVAPGTCKYSSSLQLAPGEQAIREDSIAFDDASCTMTVVRGTPADPSQPEGAPDATTAESDPAAWSYKEGGAAATGASSAPGVDSASATTALAAVHSAGYHKSYYEDPVGIDVNSVRNNVNWYWNGSYVYNGYCSYHYGWYSTSGWGLKENNFFCRYENSQTQVRSSSYVHFKNGIFCAFIDTHTYYDRNNAYGKYNGYLVGTVSAYKQGGCTGLLSFHHFLKRTLN
jgi:hypothetical protein